MNHHATGGQGYRKKLDAARAELADAARREAALRERIGLLESLVATHESYVAARDEANATLTAERDAAVAAMDFMAGWLESRGKSQGGGA